MGGGTGERLSDACAIVAFEEGNQFVSDTVPKDIRIEIARVLAEGEMLRLQKPEELGLRPTEERTDIVVPARSDAGESFLAGPPEEADEDRFGLIVFRVRGRDEIITFPFSDSLEETIPGAAECGFVPVFRAARSKYENGKIIYFGILPDQSLIGPGILAAERIIHMRDTEAEPELFPESKEDMQERDTVRPAGNGDENRDIASEKSMPDIVVADAFDECPSESGRRAEADGFRTLLRPGSGSG